MNELIAQADRQSDRELAEASRQFEARFARELKERATSTSAPRTLRQMLSMSAPNIGIQHAIIIAIKLAG